MHSARTVRTHRSAYAFARGARIGVWTILTPSERTTSSNGPENFESRSRITNWICKALPHRQVAGPLRDPRGVGSPGDAENVYPPGAQVDRK